MFSDTQKAELKKLFIVALETTPEEKHCTGVYRYDISFCAIGLMANVTVNYIPAFKWVAGAFCANNETPASLIGKVLDLSLREIGEIMTWNDCNEMTFKQILAKMRENKWI